MNILVFGPNGSGKGTQGAIIQKKYNMPHIESGAIFRKNIGGGTGSGIHFMPNVTVPCQSLAGPRSISTAAIWFRMISPSR